MKSLKLGIHLPASHLKNAILHLIEIRTVPKLALSVRSHYYHIQAYMDTVQTVSVCDTNFDSNSTLIKSHVLNMIFPRLERLLGKNVRRIGVDRQREPNAKVHFWQPVAIDLKSATSSLH